MTAFNPDQVLVPIHGRRLGLINDGASGVTGLNVDGKLVGVGGRTAFVGPFAIKLSLGSNGIGSVAFAGLLTGDLPFSVINLTDGTDVTSSFESTISIAGAIQQTAATDLSAKKLLIYVAPGAIA